VDPPSHTWEDILANSGNPTIKPIQRWTGTAWVTVAGTDTLDPLEGYYIYFMQPGVNIILYASSANSMPTRTLDAGWSLIGPNPLFTTGSMYVRHALSSISLTPAGTPGYTQAISPVVQCQEAWAFVQDMDGPGPWMISGKAYWVWMENTDTLVGFGFTPLPAGP